MAVKVLMTALSPTMEQGTIVRWTKQEGERVKSSEVLCEVETDKATMDYEAPAAGTLLKIVIAAGQTAKVGELIGILGNPGEEVAAIIAEGGAQLGGSAAPLKGSAGSDALKDEAQAPATTLEPEAAKHTIIASPLARKMASARSIDLALLKGSGPGGRIVKRDIEQYAGVPAAAGSPPVAAVTTPSFVAGVAKRVPLSGKRKLIAERLSASMFTAPHYYLTVTVEVDRLFNARKRFNTSQKEGLSLNAFLLKLAAIALANHPVVGASMGNGEIIYNGSIDIGLAVALTDGLITPVVRDCAHKGVKEIERELKDLIKRAAEGKLVPSEYTGAIFTISNLGSFGIDQFTAIINPPGSAILAVGAAKKEPVVDEEDNVVVRSRMNLTLSCDHRLIDGAVGAAFLKNLKDLIEEPMGALL